MAVINIENVKKSYHHNHAVDEVSFVIEQGETFGLIGTNGAGKSTLIAMIATLLRPDSGKITFHGEDIGKHPEVIRRALGYVPQEIALYENLSGLDNLMFWGQVYHVEKKVLKKRISEICEIIGFSEKKLQDKIKNYSGGMKRKINIGAALLHDPEIIIMDEPTVGIDMVSRNQILSMVLELAKLGKTILYTGHYMEEIESICNSICMIDHGKVLACGSTKELLSRETGIRGLEDFYLSKIEKN